MAYNNSSQLNGYASWLTPAMLSFGATALSCTTTALLREYGAKTPPKPEKVPHDVYFGRVDGEYRGENPMEPPIVRNDDLFWLRDDDRENPEILRYLEKENTHTSYMTRHLADSTNQLYREMLSRLKQTDSQVPYRHGPYQYYTRTVQGLSYPLHCRQKLHQNGNVGEEEIFLDVNVLAQGHEHCDVASVSPSPSHTMVAYGVDYEGDEDYDVHYRRCDGLHSDEILKETSGNLVWGADDNVIFYTTKDETMRPYQLWAHIVGTSQSEDFLLRTEEDGRFVLGIEKTRSERFLVAESCSKTSSECALLDLHETQDWVRKGREGEKEDPPSLTTVKPREQDVLYEVDHWVLSSNDHTSQQDLLVILTNIGGAKNFKVCVCPFFPTRQWEAPWADLIPHRSNVFVEGAECFQDFIVLEGRQDSHPHVWIVHKADLQEALKHFRFHNPAVEQCPSVSRIPTADEVYDIYCSPANEEWGATSLRYIYSSPVCPQSTYVFDVKADAGNSRAKKDGSLVITRHPSLSYSKLLKRKEVPNFNPSHYKASRIFVKVRDGTKVPVSLLWCQNQHEHVEAKGDEAPFAKPAPVFLDGYGSYGISIDMDFDYKILSLCDRGVVYAFAHVRGGGEMGRSWYEDEGKFLKKKNTFNDFVDCADGLIKLGWADRDNVATVGASAGGLLMGNALIDRPELWRCVVASVPFLDLMTTMCDPSIPLTVEEWEEWGNPNESKYYDYMLSYSPMDNIRKQPYPPTLFQAGLNDQRVAYWEPAKFATRLREQTTSNNPILLKVDLSSGHFSASDRYKEVRERAFEFAFVLDHLGISV